MGVSGAGKTLVGHALAAAVGWPFYEGDDYHSQANVDKMAHGIPLDDADRAPWLAALRDLIAGVISRGEHGVLACSALKQHYRDVLVPENAAPGAVRFVFLDVPKPVLLERLKDRKGHFMPPELLDSQLATLEHPRDAVRIDGTRPVPEIVRRVRDDLGV